MGLCVSLMPLCRFKRSAFRGISADAPGAETAAGFRGERGRTCALPSRAFCFRPLKGKTPKCCLPAGAGKSESDRDVVGGSRGTAAGALA